MLVVDASALIEVLTVDPAEIPALTRRLHDAEWINAPDLVDYEILNVLRKMVLRGDIDAELATESRTVTRSLRMNRHAMNDGMADRVWQLRHNASAYDASYVALAEHLDMPLITTERRLTEGLRGLTRIAIESYLFCEPKRQPHRK